MSGRRRRIPSDYEPEVVRALVIPTDGPWEARQIGATLTVYERIVGGFLAVYEPARTWRLYCHEATGLLQPTSVPWNETATRFAQRADPAFAVGIRGTAVIVGTGDSGQDIDVPDDLVDGLSDNSDKTT